MFHVGQILSTLGKFLGGRTDLSEEEAAKALDEEAARRHAAGEPLYDWRKSIKDRFALFKIEDNRRGLVARELGMADYDKSEAEDNIELGKRMNAEFQRHRISLPPCDG